MGLIRSIADKINKTRQPGNEVVGVGGGSTQAGAYVNEDNSMRYAAVQACVRVLSEDIAALPLFLYRRTGQGGKERASGHPLYPILRQAPNEEMTAIAFKEAIMVNVLLTGNAYAFIEMNGAGRVKSLWPMVSSEVQPYRAADGAIRYRAGGVDLSAAEVLHIPGLGFDGLMGLSPISYAREAIGLGIAAEAFGGQFFRNGTHLGGVISIPTRLSDEAFERTKTQFQQMYRGLQNAHGVPVLEGGATYTQIGIAPEDAQFLETRKYQRSEIAGIFRVPPHMIGDLEHATFSNIEHQDISYLQRSLLPWLTRIEQNMTQKLLTVEERKEYVIEHETGSFMRGDTKSRFEAYAIGIQNGILSVNEARAKENLNPVDGGDEILRPLNMDIVGSDEATGGDDGAGTTGGSARYNPPGGGFRLADVLSFTTDRRRQSVGAGRRAARPGKALREAFSAWLGAQAEAVIGIIQKAYGQRSARTDALKLCAEYFEGLMNEPMPDDLRAAVKERLNRTLDAVREELAEGEAEPLDEAFTDRYTAYYLSGLRERIVTANGDYVRKKLERAKSEEDVDAIYADLRSWSGRRADNAAVYEQSLAESYMRVAGYHEAGYEAVWRSAPGCCRLCTGLNGQTITTLKPPLHKGCGCGVGKGMLRLRAEQDNGSGLFSVMSDYQSESTPGEGSLTREHGPKQSVKQHELDTARHLIEQIGGDVVLLDNAGRDSVRDCIWHDRIWEIKKATTPHAAGKRTEIGIGQLERTGGNLIIDCQTDEYDAAESRIVAKIKGLAQESFDTIIMQNGEIRRIIRYQK